VGLFNKETLLQSWLDISAPEKIIASASKFDFGKYRVKNFFYGFAGGVDKNSITGGHQG